MKWIDRQEDFDRILPELAASGTLAIDTEADSLHSYFDKVCLIQLSTAAEDYVIDPLSKIDLDALGELLAEPALTKVFHGADYDLRIMNRDFGFVVSNLVDTMVSAQFLGYEGVGLAALLKKHFNVDLDKSHQRANWAMRPLPADMLRYAATDTHYLVALAGILRQELENLGRWEWAVEEFSRLEAIRFRESDVDDEAYRRLKGSNQLERRSLAILQRLHRWRDTRARALDRPPFKVIGNETMIEISRALPRNREELGKIPGVSGYHMRNVPEWLSMIEEALHLDEASLPERVTGKPWIRDRALDTRVEKLKRTRNAIASDLKIDPALLAPKHVLTAIAQNRPASLSELAAIPAMREWQKRVAGEALIAALHPTSGKSSGSLQMELPRG